MAKPFKVLRDRLSKRQLNKVRKVKRHLNNVIGGLRKRGATKEEAGWARGWLAIIFADGSVLHCEYCEAELTGATFSIDHGLPLSRGGGHGEDNLRLCCGVCNRRKGSLTGWEYHTLIEFMEEHFPKEAMADVLRRLAMGGYGFRK